MFDRVCDGDEKGNPTHFLLICLSLRKNLPYGTENMKCFLCQQSQWVLPWGNALELYQGILFHGPGVNLEQRGGLELNLLIFKPVAVDSFS